MTIEPEETIEAGIAAAIETAVPWVPTVRALAPSAEGTEKTDPDTRIGISVDLASQDGDWVDEPCPCSWTGSVAVRIAQADDPSGSMFLQTCRAVRRALAGFLGDNCGKLDGKGFECDEVRIDSSATIFSNDAEVGAFTKTYTVTVKGRVIPTKEEK